MAWCQLRGGRLPFEGGVDELRDGHLRREPDLAMLPEEERPVVARALAKDPQQRRPSYRAFIKALAAAQPLSPKAPPFSWKQLPSPATRPWSVRGARDQWQPRRMPKFLPKLLVGTAFLLCGFCLLTHLLMLARIPTGREGSDSPRGRDEIRSEVDTRQDKGEKDGRDFDGRKDDRAKPGPDRDGPARDRPDRGDATRPYQLQKQSGSFSSTWQSFKSVKKTKRISINQIKRPIRILSKFDCILSLILSNHKKQLDSGSFKLNDITFII